MKIFGKGKRSREALEAELDKAFSPGAGIGKGTDFGASGNGLIVPEEARLVHDENTLMRAIDLQGHTISEFYRELGDEFDFAEKPLVVVPLLKGALPYAGALITRIDVPTLIEPAYVTRYDPALNRPSDTKFLHLPDPLTFADHHVLLVDDIYDEGITLDKTSVHYLEGGAVTVRSTVLLTKGCWSTAKVAKRADWSALDVPEGEFVFGFGMDLGGRYRGLRDVWSVKPTDIPF